MIHVAEKIADIRDWGFMNAVRLTARGRANSIASLQITGWKHPVFVRRNYVDRAVLFQVLRQKQYDHEAVRRCSPGLIVDVGAHIGISTVFFANLFPQARIVAIEPDPSNFEVLALNVDKYPQVEAIRAALWHREETIGIANPDAPSWAFQLQPAADGAVQAFTMQKLIAQHGRIDLLKLDIEGAEKTLFSLAPTDWLSNVRVLCIELHDRLVPGCTQSTYAQLVQRNFQRYPNGEVDVICFDPAIYSDLPA